MRQAVDDAADALTHVPNRERLLLERNVLTVCRFSHPYANASRCPSTDATAGAEGRYARAELPTVQCADGVAYRTAGSKCGAAVLWGSKLPALSGNRCAQSSGLGIAPGPSVARM